MVRYSKAYYPLNLPQVIDMADESSLGFDGQQKLAWVISRILDPGIVLSIMIVILIWQSRVDFKRGLLWSLLLLCLAVILPLLYVLYLMRKGEISDWDISNRRERYALLFFTIFCWLLSVIILVVFDGPKLLLASAVDGLAILSVYSLITISWKISIHSGAISCPVTILIILFGPSFLPLILLVLAMIWARYKMRKHNLLQLIGGALLTSSITVLVFSSFGYLK